MSAERDELATTLSKVRHVRALHLEVSASIVTHAMDGIADAILAAGYSKPRTITTAEELDALPVGSVILDPVGLSLHRNPFTGWSASNGAKEIPAEMLQAEALPAIVLYTPEANA